MSGSVHPNPGPIFFCSVCAGNVTWRGKSVQCCTCSKWVHLRCSQLSLSKFRALDSSHSWSCSPCRNTVTPFSDSDMYTFTVQSGPPMLMVYSRLTPVFKSLTPHLPILYLLPLLPHHRSLLLAVLLRLLPPLPLTQGSSIGMLEVFKPGALNCFTFFRPILLTLSASRNPIFTHLPFSGFLDSLLCDLIARTPGLAFSLVIPRTLTAASSSSSGRAYPSLNFSTSSLSSLDPYSDYVGVNISFNNSSSLSFLNVYAPLFALLRQMAEPTPFLPAFFLPPEISLFWGISIAITPSGTREVLPTRSGRKYSTGSSLLTSSPSMTLTHLPFYIPLLTVAPFLTFSLLPFLAFLAPGRCYTTWVLTIYQFFYPSLFLWSFAPTSVPLPSIFRKLAEMILSPTLTLTVLQQRNTRLFLFPLLLFFLPIWH